MVDLKDGVLFHHPEQHQDPQHGEDVEFLAKQQQRHQRERNGQRQREQNGDRVEPRLELRGQNQVHENEGEREGDAEVARGPSDFLRLSERHESVFGRQVHVLHCFLERGADFSATHAGRGVGIEGDLALARVAIDLRRTLGALEADHVEQGHRAQLAGRYAEQTQRLGAGAVAFVGAHQDVVLVALLLVARNLDATDEKLRRLGHVHHIDAEIGGLASIDRGLDLRISGDQGRVDVDGAGDRLEPLGGFGREGGQLLQIRSGHDVLDGRRAEAASRERRHREYLDAVVLGLPGHDLVPHLVLQLILRELSLVRRNEAHEYLGEVGRLFGVVADGENGGCHLGPDAHVAGNALDGEVRGRETGPFGRADRDLELRFVVLGQKALGHGLYERDARAERCARRDHHHPAMIHHPRQEPHVGRFDGPVENIDHAFEEVLLALGRWQRIHTQPARGQHGSQAEADEERDGDGRRHGETEAFEKTARNPAHECHRHEHRQQRQRRRQHRQSDLARGIDRRRHRPHFLLVDEAEDILQHHDGVVDDDADRQRERQQGDGVHGEVHHPHRHERPDDRRGNGQRGDQRATHIAEEEQHDQGGEERTQHQVFAHGPDAGARFRCCRE